MSANLRKDWIYPHGNFSCHLTLARTHSGPVGLGNIFVGSHSEFLRFDMQSIMRSLLP